MVRLEFTAENVEALHGQMRGLLGLDKLEGALEAARVLARKQGLVVNCDPAQGIPDDKPAAEAKRGPGRPRNPPKPEPETPPAPALAAAELPKAVDPATPVGKQMTDGAPVIDKEAMIKALDAFAKANGGQVAARQVMLDVGGSARLAEIPADKWQVLLARLTSGAQQAAA